MMYEVRAQGCLRLGARERAKKQHGKSAEEAVGSAPTHTARQLTPKSMTYYEETVKRARAQGNAAQTTTYQ